jgi:hypothetical protein
MFEPSMGTPSSDVDLLLRRAIAEKLLIRFVLNGCVRIVEPHDYGIRNGVCQLLVYQIDGQSNSGPLPAWRWVRVDGASGFQLLDRTFAGGRVAPSGEHARWDRVFARVAPAAAHRTSRRRKAR